MCMCAHVCVHVCVCVRVCVRACEGGHVSLMGVYVWDMYPSCLLPKMLLALHSYSKTLISRPQVGPPFLPHGYVGRSVGPK